MATRDDDGAELVIPEGLRTTSVRWEGDRARAWLRELPSLVAAVTDAWDLDVGPPFEPGGNLSWVAPCARRAGDGTELVLKVALPHPESAPEAAALAAWGGRGAVRLLAHDDARWALLLERCVPGTSLVDAHESGAIDVRVALDAMVGIARELHAVEPPAGVPSLAVVLGSWADHLEEGRGQSPAMTALDDDAWQLALGTMRDPTGPSGRRVLLHGDLNPTNVLASGRGWLAIDPKPMVGDPAYDAGRVILQLAPGAGDASRVVGERIARVAAGLDVPAPVIATWCAVDIVEQAGFTAANGDEPEARRLLAMLDWVVPHLA